MNLVFAKPPSLIGEHYVHRTPRWLLTFFRLSFGIGALAMAAMAYFEWSRMALGFRALTCVLAPLFAFFALHRRLWEKTIKFIAADQGIFFPCNELVATVLGQKHKDAWLLVPWANITDVRMAKTCDNDNGLAKCVAFDLCVSPEEEAGFFRYVGNPTDSTRLPGSLLSVAYLDNPPSPKKTCALLKEMQQAKGAPSKQGR